MSAVTWETGRQEPGGRRRPDEDAVAFAAALRGDEAAFEALVDRHHAAAVRLALCYVESRSAAEELLRQAWVELLRTLDGGPGWTPFRARLLSMVACLARFRGAVLAEAPPGGKSDAGRPEPWRAGRVESEEALDRVRTAIDDLPPLGRAVVTMRDVAGCDASVTCAALGLSDSEHRRQLHGARSRVRAALDPCGRGVDRDRL